MNKTLPLCALRCQDLLLETIGANDADEFTRIAEHIGGNSLALNTIEVGEKIAETELSNKHQWLRTLRSTQKHRFSHHVLQSLAAQAQRNDDIPVLLFVFNELYDHHNLRRKSVLLEMFPIYHYASQVMSSASTVDIEHTLSKMLEILSPSQCRFLVLNCLKDENFTHIDAFSSQIDLKQLGEDVQIHYHNGDTELEAAVAYFQNRVLCLALQDSQLRPLLSKRKI